uniref:Uncharacterized protein n=1 Tax=Lotus japonicus TaxID=34305 RepID=I3T782_LOTJA|nr:unknown [Lotus japonicus]
MPEKVFLFHLVRLYRDHLFELFDHLGGFFEFFDQFGVALPGWRCCPCYVKSKIRNSDLERKGT